MQVDKQVGEAIRESGIPREEVFVTSKFWPQFAAPENVSTCLDIVLESMGLEYIDLFLSHFPGAFKPAPCADLRYATNIFGATAKKQLCATDEHGNYIPDLEHCPKSVAILNGGVGSFVPTWRAMQELVRSGRCRAVGLSNFEKKAVEELLPHASHEDVPISCNQIEANPWYPNTELIEFLKLNGIVPTIYSPFEPKNFAVVNGVVEGVAFAPTGLPLLQEPVVKDVAARNNMDVGQVLQSWCVQRRTIPLGKSQSRERIIKNMSLKRLPLEDMKLLSGLKLEGRKGKSTDVNFLFPGLRLI